MKAWYKYLNNNFSTKIPMQSSILSFFFFLYFISFRCSRFLSITLQTHTLSHTSTSLYTYTLRSRSSWKPLLKSPKSFFSYFFFFILLLFTFSFIFFTIHYFFFVIYFFYTTCAIRMSIRRVISRCGRESTSRSLSYT